MVKLKRRHLIISCSLIGVTGACLLAFALAAGKNARLDPEIGVVSAPAVAFRDTTAGGGGAVRFGEATGSPAASPTNTPSTSPPPGGSAHVPADVLNLTNWYITLPIAGSSATSPKTVNQPELATYTIDPWFHLSADKTGVVFHVNHGGISTSNSANPRSELREMTNNGASMASWSSTSGTSTMEIKQKVTHLTTVKPQVVVGQIHDANDDVSVFRLEGSSLYITDGNTTHAHLVTDSYTLGTVFTVKFEVSGGVIKYYYNGQLLPYTQSKSFSGAYFKAGNYLQSNPSTAPSESTSAFSEVEVYSVTVTHS